MTAPQSFKLYSIFFNYFKSDSDAKAVIEEFEKSVEVKFEEKKATLAIKEDVVELKLVIQQLKEELKSEILITRVEMEKRFNTILMWMIGTMIALVGIVVAILKLSA